MGDFQTDLGNISKHNRKLSSSPKPLRLNNSSKKDKYILHEACQKGNLAMVKEIIKKRKSDVNLKNESGHIPIHLAALHNFYEIVDLLIEAGSNLSAKDNSGWSILHFATVNEKNEKIIERLLKENDVDVKAVNDGLNTPLHYLAKNFTTISPEIFKTFIEKGADVNARNAQGETPLHGAALKNCYDIVEMLIEHGADVEITNNNGETPLNWATKAGKERSISILLRAHSANLRHRKTVVTMPSFLTPNTKVDPHIRYELTFLGKDTEVILNDENWDTCLYEGGIQLENKALISTPNVVENPHYDSIPKEDLPLSKLFNLYLSISRRNKTDPEIVYWISDFLTGPKRAYLLYLCENFSYRIRVKNSLAEKRKSSKLKKYKSFKTQYLDIWEKPTYKDKLLWKSVFENDKLEDILQEGTDMKKRILSLVQLRKTSIPWEIDYKKINIISKIGEGSFSTVYKGVWMGVEVAVKKMNYDDLGQEEYLSFLNEVVMMSNLRHPNIVMFLGACIKPPNLCFVTEYLVLGSLDVVLKKYPKLDWKVRLNIAIEAARGLAYLHNQSPPILHRDLKSLNILVNKNFHVKLTDFGYSVEKSNKLNSKMGTLNWIAPELLNGTVEIYTESADIYSFGMVLWEIISGRIPYEGKSQLQILRMIDMHETENIPEKTNSIYADIIRSCWNLDPAKRPTINEVLEKLEEIKT